MVEYRTSTERRVRKGGTRGRRRVSTICAERLRRGALIREGWTVAGRLAVDTPLGTNTQILLGDFRVAFVR